MTQNSDFSNAETQPGVRPPPIPPWTWMGAGSPLLLAPLLLLIGVAMFAPDDVLDRFALAKAFTGWTGRHISWIGNHAASTTYPQVALLMACIVVCSVMWTAGVFLMQSLVNYRKLLQRQRQYRTVTWKMAVGLTFIGVPLMFLTMVFAFAIPGDPSWAKGFTTTSRAGFVFIYGSLIYGGGLIVGGWPLAFRLLIDLDFRKDS